MSVTLDPEKFAALMAGLCADADRLEARLARIGAEDPPHWAPNNRQACLTSFMMRALECVSEHISPRWGARRREQAEADLEKQIRAQPEFEAHLYRLVGLGVLRKTEG